MFGHWRTLLRRRVIVNLTNGTAIHGVLYRQSGPLLILKNAQYLEKGVEPTTLDGDTVVERTNVIFIQAI